MKKIILLGAVFTSFLLTACNEKIYTVEEFKADKALRDKIFQKCNKGELNKMTNENCLNALNAKLVIEGPTQWSR